MKKNLFYSLLMAFAFSLTFGLTSCNSCSGDTPENENNVAEVMKPVVLDVENVISTDRQTMFLMAGGDNVRWYETTIVLSEPLSAPDCTNDVKEIVNTFQKIVKSGDGYDTMVYQLKHCKDGTYEIDSVAGWWAEDSPLNDEPIKLSFNDAFNQVMKANIVKPQSRYCVLRKEVGPKDCNPQYIFGNTKSQVYVDAVTGNVKGKNPVFEGIELAQPLGEWP